MQYVLFGAIFLLMLSVGMSLHLKQLITQWRSLSWARWFALTMATFVIPPALALLLANLFRLSRPELVGLFMVGAAPGAPLLTRNLSRRGLNLHVAASYQIWAGLMVPIMLPLVVWAAGLLYDRHIWIRPRFLVEQIALKEFVPVIIGMLIAWFAPKWAQRALPVLNVLGNVGLTVIIVAVLIKMGPLLKNITPLVPVAAVLLALGSLGAIFLFRAANPATKDTFALCNVNRHVGLAVLIAGQYMHVQEAIPAVACYALIAPLVIIVYVKRVLPIQKMTTAEGNVHS
jgi:bile acid:Na+ symporter, BASS family